VVCGSVFISFVTNTMASVTRKTLHVRQILQAVQKYCSLNGIPPSYSRQVKSYIERQQQRVEVRRHVQLLHELPNGMLTELFQYARSQTLQQHPFFKEVGDCNYLMEVDLCSLAVSEIYHLRSDTIFDMKYKTQGMYIMAHGRAVYSSSSLQLMPKTGTRNSEPDGSQSRMLSILSSVLPMLKGNAEKNSMAQTTALRSGEHIGEPALWVRSWRYQGRLVASVESRCLLVSAEDLFKVLQEHSDILFQSITYARLFIREFNKAAQLGPVTDLPLIACP